MTNKFKVGDRVKCIEDNYICEKDTEWIIERIEGDVLIINSCLGFERGYFSYFELVERKNKCGHTNYEGKEWGKISLGDTPDRVPSSSISIGGIDNYNKMMDDKYKNEPKPIINENFETIRIKFPEKEKLEIDPKFLEERINEKTVAERGLTLFPEKEEFKVDKLGWYKSKGNPPIRDHFYKVLHIGKEYLFCIDEMEIFWRIELDGKNYHYNSLKNIWKTQFTLTEYVGPELPKEPRKFEFEAELGEEDKVDEMKSQVCAIDKVIGHTCTNLMTKIFQRENYEKVSKWKVTMTEIIENE